MNSHAPPCSMVEQHTIEDCPHRGPGFPKTTSVRGRRRKNSRGSRETTAVGDIHDGTAEFEELIRRNRLGKEIGGIIVSLNQRHD